MSVLHFGYLLLVPFAFVAARLARRGAPKLATAGLVLGVLGSGLSSVALTDAYWPIGLWAACWLLVNVVPSGSGMHLRMELSPAPMLKASTCRHRSSN